MLSILPREITDILFILLPITDKRNFLRCNREFNTKTKFMTLYENEFMLKIKQFYHYLPSDLSKLEKYTIEIIFDNYEHLMPDKYICKQNKLCTEGPFMYFYCAANKHMKLLKKLLEFDRKYANYMTDGTAYAGHLAVLQWARQNGCEWDSWTCGYAAKNGHLEMLQWARQNGCDWDSFTCSWAAINGHLRVLQWARQNGCDWNSSTCSNAALNGHLEVLQWARQNGCEWNSLTFSNAAENGHLEVLEWARQNGCPEY